MTLRIVLGCIALVLAVPCVVAAERGHGSTPGMVGILLVVVAACLLIGA